MDKYSEQYSEGVRGIVENHSDTTLDYVEVRAVFLDKNGVQIGDGLDNVSDLSGGRRWQFDIGYYGDDPVYKYELSASLSPF